MPETKRALKVFLCHAHSDKNTVRDLYLRLTEDGIDAWLDKEKLLPGQDWEYEIRKAVREADIVVVCLSKQFNQAGFRQKEVRLALETAMEKPEGEIFIIPLRLEECNMLESLRKWHWVDLFEESGYSKFMKALKTRAAELYYAPVNLPETAVSAIDQGFSPSVNTRNRSEDSDMGSVFSHITSSIIDIFFSRRVLFCGFLGVFVGGFIWIILNNLLGWPYYLGGPGNEPHGFSAFIWGFIVVFPVAFFAYLAVQKYILTNFVSLQRTSLVIALYSIFGGVGAFIFYSFGFRSYIEAQKLGYGNQELIIVLIWSLVISLSASFPALLLSRVFKELLDPRYIFLQILLSIVLSFLAVVVSLFIHLPESQVALLRGFLAGLGLRLGLFVGIVLSIYLKPNALKQ